jgi:hypothetical protein
MKFGSVRLDILRGGDLHRDGESLFGVVPKALWERRFPPDSENRVRLAANGLLVRGRGFTLVVASAAEETASEDEVALVRALAEKGVRPADVDVLVRPRPRGPGSGGTFKSAALCEGVTSEVELRSGVRVIPLPGHGAGALAVRIDSLGHTAFYFGDALPTTAHVPIAWTLSRDRYPAELLQNKKHLLDAAAREGWLCIFEHDPDVPWGRIVDGPDGKRRIHPVAVGAPVYLPR